MLNTESLNAVNAACLNEHFGKPLYESYGFAQLPQTVYHLLTGEGSPGLPLSVLGDLPRQYDKVILIFADAFGWRFFERYGNDYPFLQRFETQGVVSKLTTQFPSTTAAHITTIHTGLPVIESGVYEWFYYEPLVDAVIAPLTFSFAGDKERNTLSKANIPAAAFCPPGVFYRRLREGGVAPHVFQSRLYTPSPYSDAVFGDAKVIPYTTLSEAFVNLVTAVSAANAKGYFFLYFDLVDAIGHQYGPSSRHFDAEADTLLTVLERQLHRALSEASLKNTLLLVTADHGQMEVSPKTTIYLNQVAPWLEPLLKTNRQGKPLVPAGSARDMFLYVQDQHLYEVQARLTKLLAGRAEVYFTQALIEQGVFGTGKPSEAFLKRVGNLVILPYARETVWWYEKDRFEQIFYGHHGGLAREEMETILLALPYL